MDQNTEQNRSEQINRTISFSRSYLSRIHVSIPLRFELLHRYRQSSVAHHSLALYLYLYL